MRRNPDSGLRVPEVQGAHGEYRGAGDSGFAPGRCARVAGGGSGSRQARVKPSARVFSVWAGVARCSVTRVAANSRRTG
jgi:hypothetical protein